MFATQTNPLLARANSRRNTGLALSLAAAIGVFAAGTIAVSAKTAAQTQPQQTAQSASGARVAIASNAQTPAVQRRQVRIIPLFDVPGDQTGFKR